VLRILIGGSPFLSSYTQVNKLLNMVWFFPTL